MNESTPSSSSGSGPYSNTVLALAADIAHLGALARPDGSARKVSRICGSQVQVDLDVRDGQVADLGLEVSACVLGQASASVFARGAPGANRAELAEGLSALEAMLKSNGPPPQGRFSALAALAPARDYRQRHGSILLAFQAGLAAFDAAIASEG